WSFRGLIVEIEPVQVSLKALSCSRVAGSGVGDTGACPGRISVHPEMDTTRMIAARMRKNPFMV
ncbi:MAG: hypothetical protein HGA55_05015, partial [Methanoregulaceae archaeon]|nr:hypothetical protein [Methanoregulaceae archaeon]